MSEGKLVPRIRFQGFEDKWTKCKFVDILDPQNGIRRGPFGSSLRKDSFVNNSDYVVYEQQNAIYNKYETRYNISKTKFEKLKRFEILPGDFIMSGAGTIGKISEVPIGIKRGIFNQALIRFRINTGKTYRRYFLTFMRSNIMQKKLTEQNPGSAITNLVSMKEVKNYLIVIPIRKEQQKIGDLFAKLDRLLDLQQQKLDRLRLLKKALLQKLFPHRGAKIPELRFQGFEDEWKEEQLDEIVNRFDSQRIPVTASKRVPGTTPYYGANGIQDFVDGYTHQGEFILIAEDGADDLNDYPVRYVTGRIWVNNHAHVIQSKSNKIDNVFIAYALKNKNMIPYLVGSGRAKLNANILMQISLNVPLVVEQKAIGNMLHKIDVLIGINSKRLHDLEQVKKALLQNMFVE